MYKNLASNNKWLSLFVKEKETQLSYELLSQ